MTIIGDIVARIEEWGAGSVFMAAHFLDLSGRPAIAQSLHRLQRRGVIRRIGRGLFEYPRFDASGNPLPPDLETVARAIAAAKGARIQLAGQHAAAALGLFDEPPGKVVFLTDGASRRLHVEGRELELRHVGARQLIGVGSLAGTVYQALRFLGEDGADDRVVGHLARKLSPAAKAHLAQQARYFPAWMLPIVGRITEASRAAVTPIPAISSRAYGMTPHERSDAKRPPLMRWLLGRVRG